MIINQSKINNFIRLLIEVYQPIKYYGDKVIIAIERPKCQIYIGTYVLFVDKNNFRQMSDALCILKKSIQYRYLGTYRLK